MKRLTTLVFAALIAVTLSTPAWSQAATGNQPKAAAKNQSKESKEDKKGKKEAKAKKKAADKDATKKTGKKK